MTQIGFQAVYLGLQGRLIVLLLCRLAVLLELGIQNVAGYPKGSCNVSHRHLTLSNLFNSFDFESFWITLTDHGTSNAGLILRQLGL
ncbi:hypothetical protein A9X70_14050 [Aeromonas hydrophila]|nr:hypothetical protein A9X70_14050 [Aeromonas hydrophila]